MKQNTVPLKGETPPDQVPEMEPNFLGRGRAGPSASTGLVFRASLPGGGRVLVGVSATAQTQSLPSPHRDAVPTGADKPLRLEPG